MTDTERGTWRPEGKFYPADFVARLCVAIHGVQSTRAPIAGIRVPDRLVQGVRALVDTNGRYLWEPSFTGGQGFLLGYPVEVSALAKSVEVVLNSGDVVCVDPASL